MSHTLSFKQFHSTVALMQTRPGKCKQCATVDSIGKSTLCWRNMLVLVCFSKQTDDDDDDDDDVISERWHDFHVCYCILRDNLLWLCVGQISPLWALIAIKPAPKDPRVTRKRKLQRYFLPNPLTWQTQTLPSKSFGRLQCITPWTENVYITLWYLIGDLF